MTSGAVVVSGQPGTPVVPAERVGPTLAGQLAPGHTGVVWHATSGAAALELVTGRSPAPKGGKGSGLGLEVADRLSLARGPGGRSVLVELDPGSSAQEPHVETRGKGGVVLLGLPGGGEP